MPPLPLLDKAPGKSAVHMLRSRFRAADQFHGRGGPFDTDGTPLPGWFHDRSGSRAGYVPAGLGQVK